MEPESPTPSGNRCQETKNGFGPAVAIAVFEILHRLLEVGARHIGETARGGLPWCVLDAIAGDAIPVTDPHPAKGAIAIEDEEWAVWHLLITPFVWGILSAGHHSVHGNSRQFLAVAGGTASCQLTVGGIAATVTYCGVAPGKIIDQLNLQYPSGVSSGAPVEAVLTINSASGRFWFARTSSARISWTA
jgi:hypothetical protein